MVLRAILLGLIQGPTEMAPVSSSAHLALARDACGWQEDDPAREKAFDVALHGGAAAALGIAMAGRLSTSWRRLSGGRRARLSVLLASLLPPVATGFLLEGPIERRLSGRRAIAAGLALGAAAMAAADGAPEDRAMEQAGPGDGLALGLAQAAALAPGISRRGATLAAARLRGFSPADADELSWVVALPVIVGACALKGWRLARGGRGRSAHGRGRSADGHSADGHSAHERPAHEREQARAAGREGWARTLIAGTAASFGSTLLASRWPRSAASGRGEAGRLLPFALYRLALASALLLRAELPEAHNGNKSPEGCRPRRP